MGLANSIMITYGEAAGETKLVLNYIDLFIL